MQLVEIGYIKKMQNNKDDCMRNETAALYIAVMENARRCACLGDVATKW